MAACFAATQPAAAQPPADDLAVDDPAVDEPAATGLPLANLPLANLPWGDVPVRVNADAVVIARLGLPSSRVESWNARRLSARRQAEERALAALHTWVDEQLAAALASPSVASAAHRAIDASMRVQRVRPLVDGSAVVLAAVPREALRAAADVEGVPW